MVTVQVGLQNVASESELLLSVRTLSGVLFVRVRKD